jgi:hypothetical protein
MLIDTRTQFAENAAFDGGAGTVKHGDAIDLSVAPTDQGEGYPLFFVASIGTTAGAGGTSLAVNLVTADNEALDSNPVTLLSTPAIATASLTAGARLIAVPLPKATYKRWLGVTITRVGTLSAGTLRTFLVQDPPNWRAYKDAVN